MKPFLCLCLFAVGIGGWASSVTHGLDLTLGREPRLAMRISAQAISATTAEARQITARISDDPVTTEDLIRELREVNRKLDRLTTEVEELKAWVDRRDNEIPKLAFDIKELQRHRNTNYIQFQFRDTGARPGGFSSGRGKQHALVFRRLQFGFVQQVDAKTRMRVSFDGSTGSGNTSFDLRDAVLDFDLGGAMLSAGQMAVPVGFENPRSSADREFPDHITYNRVFFDSERNRGLLARTTQGAWTGVLGLGSSLTFNDLEQRGTPSVNRFAGYAGVRFSQNGRSLGLSHFQGERPGLTANAVTHPELRRRFTYLDGHVLEGPFEFRAEGMVGHDRRPVDRNNAPTSPRLAADVSGYQVQLGYAGSWFVRYGVSDFDTDSDLNSVREYGIAYRYRLNPNAWLTTSWETFEDLGAPNNPGPNDRVFRVVTARYQFRF